MVRTRGDIYAPPGGNSSNGRNRGRFAWLVVAAALIVSLGAAGAVIVVRGNDCSLPAEPAIVFDRQEPIGSSTYAVSPSSGCLVERVPLPNQAKVFGDRIVFVNSPDEGDEIYVEDLGGGNRHRVSLSPGVNIRPEWSPDGTRIVFVSTRDGNSEIYVVSAEGGPEALLTADPAHDIEPEWSPDGTQIAFVSNRDGNEEIYLMSAEGGPAQRLTSNAR